MKTSLALLASVMLCAGCMPTLVVPDQSIPHQLSADVRAEILVTHPNGQVERQKVKLPAGWWVASPVVVEAE
jgi:hypothetical protein